MDTTMTQDTVTPPTRYHRHLLMIHSTHFQGSQLIQTTTQALRIIETAGDMEAFHSFPVHHLLLTIEVDGGIAEDAMAVEVHPNHLVEAEAVAAGGGPRTRRPCSRAG